MDILAQVAKLIQVMLSRDCYEHAPVLESFDGECRYRCERCWQIRSHFACVGKTRTVASGGAK